MHCMMFRIVGEAVGRRRALWLCGMTALAMAAGSAAQGEAKKMRIVLVGDSTVTDEAGWGAGFKNLLNDNAECINTARGGRSSKSFINEGHWQKALDLKADFVLIQFGHNDQPGKGPERETDPNSTYAEWMRRYVVEARAAGAKPVLVTSMTRRGFSEGKLRDTLGPYAEAVRKLAAAEKGPLVDLYTRSTAAVERLGEQASEGLGPVVDGKPDRSHLNARGSEAMARLVAEELRRAMPDLAPYLKE
jgi:lysophospholipase L1-like esterase